MEKEGKKRGRGRDGGRQERGKERKKGGKLWRSEVSFENSEFPV